MCVRKRTKGSTILGLKLNLVFSVKPLSMGRDANAWVFTGEGDIVGHGGKKMMLEISAMKSKTKTGLTLWLCSSYRKNNIEEEISLLNRTL